MAYRCIVLEEVNQHQGKVRTLTLLSEGGPSLCIERYPRSLGSPQISDAGPPYILLIKIIGSRANLWLA